MARLRDRARQLIDAGDAQGIVALLDDTYSEGDQDSLILMGAVAVVACTDGGLLKDLIRAMREAGARPWGSAFAASVPKPGERREPTQIELASHLIAARWLSLDPAECWRKWTGTNFEIGPDDYDDIYGDLARIESLAAAN